MLTYNLFKNKSMLLSAMGRKGKLDGDSQSIQNPEHVLVSYKQRGPPVAKLQSVQNPEHALVSNK